MTQTIQDVNRQNSGQIEAPQSACHTYSKASKHGYIKKYGRLIGVNIDPTVQARALGSSFRMVA
jgi:hypothetical protein